MLSSDVPEIEKSEYIERRRRLAKSCEEAGLRGALVWSRHGTASDRAGYSIYLVNYYTKFFAGLDDFPPFWASRGQSAVILPVKGEAALVKDMIPYDEEKVARAINDVRHDYNLIRTIITSLQEKGLDHGRVGLIGSQIISLKHFEQIKRALPHVEWVAVDDLLIDQMVIKSDAELKIIRHGCEAVSEVTDGILEAAQPGVTEIELVERTARGLAERGCELFWMRPNSLRPLEKGDIYYMAIVGWCEGYFFDISRNKIVAAKPNTKKAGFLTLLNEFVIQQTEELRPGRTAGDAAKFGLHYFIEEKKEFSRAEFEAGILGTYAGFGHGLGLSIGKPFVREGDETVLEPGMYLAVEACYPKPGIGYAEAEVNVEITEKRPRILTRL